VKLCAGQQHLKIEFAILFSPYKTIGIARQWVWIFQNKSGFNGRRFKI
jgi:hypothetical protein